MAKAGTDTWKSVKSQYNLYPGGYLQKYLRRLMKPMEYMGKSDDYEEINGNHTSQ